MALLGIYKLSSKNKSFTEDWFLANYANFFSPRRHDENWRRIFRIAILKNQNAVNQTKQAALILFCQIKKTNTSVLQFLKSDIRIIIKQFIFLNLEV